MDKLEWIKGYDDRIQENNIKYHNQELGDNSSKPLVRTIGAAGDFKTFAEAQVWFNQTIVRGGSAVEFKVLDAVHNEVIEGDSHLFKVAKGGNVKFSTDVSTVIHLSGEGAFHGFYCGNMSQLQVSNISIVNDAFGTNAGANAFEASLWSSIVVLFADVTGFRIGLLVGKTSGATAIGMNFYDMTSATISVVSVTSTSTLFMSAPTSFIQTNGITSDGIFVGTNSVAYIDRSPMTFTGVHHGIQVVMSSVLNSYDSPMVFTDVISPLQVSLWDLGGTIKLDALSALTFNNVTTEYNVPLNEIQLDDGYISTMDAPLRYVGEPSVTEYVLSPEYGNSLPTVDPGVIGSIWNNLGVLTVSA